MKKYLLLILVLQSFVSAQSSIDRNAQPPKDSGTEFMFPSMQSYELKNGLKVFIVQKKSVPLVEMELLIRAGTINEKYVKAGVAGLVSQMLFMGTKNRSAQDIADELNRLGITMFSSPNYEYSIISAKCGSDYVRQSLDIVSDVAINPLFPDQFINLFKQQLSNTLEGQLRDPVQTASLVFFTQIYGQQHPYGRSISGTFASIDSLQHSDVEDFYSSYYRPNNASLIISGDVDPMALMKIITDRFDGWEKREIPFTKQTEFPIQDSLNIFAIHDSSSDMAQVRIGHLSIPRNSPQFLSAITMNQIFGGDVISRMNMNLWVNKKISTTFRSMFGFHHEAGFFVASGSCVSDSVPTAIDAVLSGFSDMMNKKVSKGELEYGQKSLIKSYDLEFETNAQIVKKIQDCFVFHFPFESYMSYVQKIKSLRADDIEMAAQMNLDPLHATIVIIGNVSSFYQQLYNKYKNRFKVMNPAQ